MAESQKRVKVEPTPDKFVCFYNQNHENGCFSNFSQHPFVIDGVHFKTSEHALMYRKAELFGDADIAKQILVAKECKQAKSLGRKVKSFSEEEWSSKRLGIMIDILKHKAEQNEDVKRALLATGEKTIVETTPRDKIWGSGCGAEKVKMGKGFAGQNLLGVAWMRVRDYFVN